jgi:hypothetical protein
MVVLHYKKTDLNQFLYETHSQVKVDDLLNEVCESKSTRKFLSAYISIITLKNAVKAFKSLSLKNFSRIF